MGDEIDLQVDDCPCCQQTGAEIPEENSQKLVIDMPIPFHQHHVLQRKFSPLSLTLFEKEEPTENPKWSGKLDFLASCIGYSVGLGNMWRFPYLAYKNGGAIFFIPYLIMLVFVGWPLFFLEMSFGQYSGRTSIAIWSACPIFEGIGYAMVIASLLITLYYNVLIGWGIFFLFDSFRSEVPFQFCNSTWNTEHCYRKEDDDACTGENSTNLFYNQTCFNETEALFHNVTQELINQIHRVLPSEEYFKYNVLGLSDGISCWGELRWENAVCLGASWTLMVICLFKGIKTSGKIVYFTATFPYLVLLAFLIRGLMLEGALNGIKYYLIPDFKRLADPNVWIDAAGQALFSLGIAFGGLMSLSSYNRFHNNALRDAVTIFFADTFTSFLSGCAIFAILGFLAHETKQSITDVIQAGSGLAFVAYPEVIVKMPLPAFWSVLFFFMLVTLGTDSVIAILETVSITLSDRFPVLRTNKRYFLLGCSLLLFLLALPLCTDAGLYWFTILNDYAASWTVLWIALVEDIAVIFVYGINRFCSDIESMIGPNPWRKVTAYWKICWLISIPGLITGVMVFYWASYSRTPFEPAFPLWAEIVGWVFALLTIAVIPAVILYSIFTKNRHLRIFERITILSWPTADWKPAIAGGLSTASDQSTTQESVETIELTITSSIRDGYLENSVQNVQVTEHL
ncbi:sodium-dependent proline transporter-like isoform X2 [Paramacrobiotus metropolitanus]|uniref:sodium-dependent proline transporter-like isoform X2 n=1 Tax=Paramacrobiotus metropolitanus TaxID=2943436 RepID=UPI00244561D3|nr:sodium-dependent proline transporter-like isoform X2 [Paramacrobiotus metropolitanus]